MSANPTEQSTENTEEQQNEQPQQENTIQIEVELHVKNTDENKVNDIEKQDNIQETLETETKKHHIAHPSIVALVNKEVTWKECLNPYHLARLGISGGIAMIFSVLILAGIAYALNSNPCIIGQPKNAQKLDPDSIFNMIIFCLRMSIFVMPIIKIFGHEWLWTNKKIKCTMILAWIIVFVFFVPAGFFSKSFIGIYVNFILIVGALFALIYVFVLSGFYVFWLVFPFGIAAIIAFIVIIIGSWIFEFAIRPDGNFFSISYTIYLLVFQSVTMKFHLYQIPYKCGKCCTCCCNKGKSRKARNNNVTVQDELSDTVLFWYSMIIISIVETFRMAGYTALQDERGNFSGLYSFIFFNIFTEMVARNAIVWEIIYKCMKKEVPPRSRVDAIYYGATNQGEFIPIWTLLLINILNFGPQLECCQYRNAKLSPIVNIFSNWWLIPVLLVVQFVQIIVSEL
eukprot:306951_1